MLLACGFNAGNALDNGWYLFGLSGDYGYPRGWLGDPRFGIGLVLFIAGYGVNRWADLSLCGLPKPGETWY